MKIARCVDNDKKNWFKICMLEFFFCSGHSSPLHPSVACSTIVKCWEFVTSEVYCCWLLTFPSSAPCLIIKWVYIPVVHSNVPFDICRMAVSILRKPTLCSASAHPNKATPEAIKGISLIAQQLTDVQQFISVGIHISSWHLKSVAQSSNAITSIIYGLLSCCYSSAVIIFQSSNFYLHRLLNLRYHFVTAVIWRSVFFKYFPPDRINIVAVFVAIVIFVAP